MKHLPTSLRAVLCGFGEKSLDFSLLCLIPLPNLGIIWRCFGGALAGPYLPVHVCEHPIGPPIRACALDAVSMVTAAPGPGEEQLDTGAGRTDVSLWISQKLVRELVCAGQREEKRG